MDVNTIIKNANETLKTLGLSPSQITEAIAASYGITGIGTVNNEVDAFRHAYSSAVATYLMGEGVAKAVGDYNEDRLGSGNPPNCSRSKISDMDFKEVFISGNEKGCKR